MYRPYLDHAATSRDSGAGPEATAKSLGLLKEVLPRARRLGGLYFGGNAYIQATRRQFERACQDAGLDSILVEMADPDRIENAIRLVNAQDVDVLIFGDDVASGDLIVAAKGATAHNGRRPLGAAKVV